MLTRNEEDIKRASISIFGGIIAAIIMQAVRQIAREEKKEDKPKVLICSRCKNRVQENWDTCPYCGRELRRDT